MAKKVQTSKVCAFLYLCAKLKSSAFKVATNHIINVKHKVKTQNQQKEYDNQQLAYICKSVILEICNSIICKLLK